MLASLALATELVSAGERSSSVIPEPITPISVAPAGSLPDNGYLTFFLDNDLFSGTDQNYTNGVRLSYITEGKPIINIPFIQKNLHRLSGGDYSSAWVNKILGFENPKEVEYSYGFALTQLMYTPRTINTLTPPRGEHPYAGWLGIGFSLHARNAHALHSVEFSLGVVGPYSYAQESQDFIHDQKDVEK